MVVVILVEMAKETAETTVAKMVDMMMMNTVKMTVKQSISTVH